MSVRRPNVVFNEKSHTYTLDGKRLLGVSSVAKIGEQDTWGVASAWAWRIGYEGAVEVLKDCHEIFPYTKEEMREELKRRRLTPWHKRDSAARRGTAIHDALEHLAQHEDVPVLENFPENERGYVRALCRWYVDYRPSFEATEVQVVSEKYGYAGRYDVRAIGPWQIPSMPFATELALIDLKTSKSVYPTSHFPQLAGYELASVEMGFQPTDAQYILRVGRDGEYEFVRSTATAEHFLAFLDAQRAIIAIDQSRKEQG
jgi:hypothetical protein